MTRPPVCPQSFAGGTRPRRRGLRARPSPSCHHLETCSPALTFARRRSWRAGGADARRERRLLGRVRLPGGTEEAHWAPLLAVLRAAAGRARRGNTGNLDGGLLGEVLVVAAPLELGALRRLERQDVRLLVRHALPRRLQVAA